MTNTDWDDWDDSGWDDKATRHRSERQHVRNLLDRWQTIDHDTAWDTLT